MASRKNGLLSSRALTIELRKLADEAETIDNEGNPKTKAQQLAELVWKLALGYTEERRDDDGNLQKVYHPPVSWAIQFVYERTEGKAGPVQAEVVEGVKAADRVRDLAKAKLNKLAAVTAGPPRHQPKP